MIDSLGKQGGRRYPQLRSTPNQVASLDNTGQAVVVAAQLALLTQPQNADPKKPLSSIQVQVQDNLGNAVAGTYTITVAIGTNPSQGTLSGTLSQSTGGTSTATFADLSIDLSGNGYTLVFASAGLTSATSNPFNIASVESGHGDESLYEWAEAFMRRRRRQEKEEAEDMQAVLAVLDHMGFWD